jgi:ribosome-binding protein aMBF1 (putative translation factor)
MSHVVSLSIDGKEYTALPRSDYLRLVGKKELEGAVDASDYARRSLGATLRAAREAAGLSQAELAKRLKKSQPMVSGAEGGAVHVGARYVAAVLKACGLPKDWKAPRPRRGQ